MLILVAAAATLQGIGVPISDIFGKKKESPAVQGPLESRGEMWRRISANEQNIAILQATMRNLENGQADIKQDVRELLRQVGQLRR